MSLGRGVELYRAVEKKLRQDLDTPDQNHRYNLVNRLNTIYRTAHRARKPRPGRGGVPTTSAISPSSRLPEVLKRQTNNYTSMVSETANALHEIAGPRDGLAFLVERIDAEPGWFRLNNQDGWSQHCYTLGQWRTEVKDLGEVEKPLLAIVLKELRRDLQSRQQRNRMIYTEAQQLLLGRERGRLRPHGRRSLGRGEAVRRGLPVHRRVPVLGAGSLSAGDRDPAGRPSSRGAR